MSIATMTRADMIVGKAWKELRQRLKKADLSGGDDYFTGILDAVTEQFTPTNIGELRALARETPSLMTRLDFMPDEWGVERVVFANTYLYIRNSLNEYVHQSANQGAQP